MNKPSTISIPLINTNEPSALLAGLHIIAGQYVRKGDKLCTLETTKSTVELTAEDDGYVIELRLKEGELVQAGEILCYLAESPDWMPPKIEKAPAVITPSIPQEIRISQPALSLAQKYGLDLSQFPSDVFITEKIVQELVNSSAKTIFSFQDQAYEPNSIIIYGGGGHSKALIDLIWVLGTYSIAGIIDDGITAGSSIMGVPVLGGVNLLEQLFACGVQFAANAVGGIGNISSRINVFERLKKVGFTCPILQHPTSFIEASAILADGVQVMPHAYIGSEAKIGFGVIINTGAIVSHDCTLGDYANLSPGAILAGEVSVGDSCLIGMGATINLRVRIGSRARIGNGATVKQDVPEAGIIHAGTIWPG